MSGNKTLPQRRVVCDLATFAKSARRLGMVCLPMTATERSAAIGYAIVKGLLTV